MNKYIIPILAGALLSVANASDGDTLAKIEKMEKEIKKLKKSLTKVKAHDANDNIKFSVDFRSSYDNIKYKMGIGDDIKPDIFSNRLILKMAAQPLENLIFKGEIVANAIYGANNINPLADSMNGFQNMPWFANETPDDNTLRLKEAYFIYFGDMGVPYTFSIGRRPATDGMLVNLREGNEEPKSPIGHNINMEFDGASFKVDVPPINGAYVKLCLGRGYSPIGGKYSSYGTPPYYNDGANMDLVGILASLYNDGQYKIMFNYFQAYNVLGANVSQAPTQTTPAQFNLVDVGDMTGGALSIQIDGIGEEINDFLDETTIFASYAWSETDPKGANHGVITPNGVIQMKEMLGSTKSERGDSYYLGLQIPFFTDGGRFGVEYNHGSKYWRSFTYGEDTLAGSKLAARGDAYEAYLNQPLIGKNLSMQIRYTHIEYDYTGSDGFFGSFGAPMSMQQAKANGINPVEEANNFRLSLRYTY